ncbi:HlyD family efflux transporter periplasmic adaptor subunit [Pseudomonas qingdaonensis]|nr:HlyD family efflux transporter periplasmic adaptor subunit [Pseudomonas qingdaonensis]
MSAQRAERASTTRTQAQATLKGADAGWAMQQARHQVLASQQREARPNWCAARPSWNRPRRPGPGRERPGRHQVRAPFDGVVGQRKVRVQQYVSPGLPLLAVVPVEQAYVVANFKETQLEHMRPGGARPWRWTPSAGTGRARSTASRPARGGVRAVAARQRHRQLHQDRAALCRAYSPRPGGTRHAAAAAGHVGDRHHRYAHGAGAR